MRRLTILRHAHASDTAPSGVDFDRPLNVQGLAAARVAANHIGATLPQPERLRVSPALRTRQTAQLLCELAFPALQPDFVTGLYLANLDALLDEVRATPDACGHLLIVGHNPGLSELYARLAQEPQFAGLAPAAWTSLQLSIDSWAALAG